VHPVYRRPVVNKAHAAQTIRKEARKIAKKIVKHAKEEKREHQHHGGGR